MGRVDAAGAGAGAGVGGNGSLSLSNEGFIVPRPLIDVLWKVIHTVLALHVEFTWNFQLIKLDYLVNILFIYLFILINKEELGGGSIISDRG